MSRTPSPDEARRAVQEAAGAAGAKAEPEPVLLPAIPAYPVEALVGPLADLVSSTALPTALVAGAGLGALAGLCGLADLRMHDDSLVRPTLWIPLVAPRGGAKTPSLDRAFGALRDLDATEHSRYLAEMADWRALPSKERGEVPPDTTRRIDDATLEVVARWLDRGDGTGVVDTDELSGWLQAIGQYKRISGDKGRWLAMWSAQPWRYQRVGSDRDGGIGIDVYIARPVVSIVGGLQPHLHQLLGDADSGFRPRWLPHLSAEKVSWRSQIHPPDQWTKVITELYRLRRPREWLLTADALALWQAASEEWKRQASAADTSASASAALDKADIQCARIALVLAESRQPGAGGELPAKAMTCAVAITGYVMDCWRALPSHEAFALSYRDEKLARKVDELATWLETRGDKKATRRDIMRSRVAGVRSAHDMSTLILEYEQVYPGTVAVEQPAGGGRPGQVVHAPDREHAASQAAPVHTPPEFVSGDKLQPNIQVSFTEETAGSRQVGEFVSSGDKLAGDKLRVTNSATDSHPSEARAAGPGRHRRPR